MASSVLQGVDSYDPGPIYSLPFISIPDLLTLDPKFPIYTFIIFPTLSKGS